MAYDLQIAAMTVYMESSGEAEAGQIAVINVLMNRLKSKRWGYTLAEVCLKAYQFSSWNTKDPNRIRAARLPDDNNLLRRIEQLVSKALAGELPDTTGGALFYLAPALCDPEWAKRMKRTASIGAHWFFTDVL